MSPYIPADIPKLKNIPTATVPYISALDLIVFKINSCGLRANIEKREVDALDAETLLAREANMSSLRLTEEQKTIVENSLPDVLLYSSHEEKWWRKKLGLPKIERTASWAWSEEFGNWFRILVDGSCEWYVEGQSLGDPPMATPSKSSKDKSKKKR